MRIPELWESILLHVEITDLLQLRLVSPDIVKITESDYFWRTRFINAQLPLIKVRLSFSAWFNEYRWLKTKLIQYGDIEGHIFYIRDKQGSRLDLVNMEGVDKVALECCSMRALDRRSYIAITVKGKKYCQLRYLVERTPTRQWGKVGEVYYDTWYDVKLRITPQLINHVNILTIGYGLDYDSLK